MEKWEEILHPHTYTYTNKKHFVSDWDSQCSQVTMYMFNDIHVIPNISHQKKKYIYIYRFVRFNVLKYYEFLFKWIFLFYILFNVQELEPIIAI